MFGVLPPAFYAPSRRKLVFNGTFESQPSFTAATNTNGRWIDGTAGGSLTDTTWGWAVPALGITASAEAKFDSTVSFLGQGSMKLSTLNATGAVTVTNALNSSTPTAERLFILQPNSSYTFQAMVKTNNVTTNGAFIDLRQYSSALASLVTTSSNKLSGTNGFTLVSLTVTTNASAAYGAILLRNNVAGNTSDAWFDAVRKG